MKLIFALIPTCTLATYMQMAADYLKLQKFEENRNVAEIIGLQAFEDIDGYGCWCYFEDDHGLGRSAPQDVFDTHCRTIHDGYTCAIMDHGDTCIPWEVDYNSGIESLDVENLVSLCESNNAGNDCAISACKVEGLFVYELFQLATNNNQADPQTYGVKNGWDREEECPVAPGQIESNIVDTVQCCGDQPYRHPFHTRGGLNQCCGITLMNTVSQECCSGNPDSPAPIGGC